MSTAGVFGGASFLTLCWLCDWKLIMAQVPVYGKKYEIEPPK